MKKILIGTYCLLMALALAGCESEGREAPETEGTRLLLGAALQSPTTPATAPHSDAAPQHLGTPPRRTAAGHANTRAAGAHPSLAASSTRPGSAGVGVPRCSAARFSTRSGLVGTMGYAQLAQEGFGVYASGSDGSLNWANKPVTYIGTKPATDLADVHLHPANWQYDSEQLVWTPANKLTFFAYAPWVDGNAAFTTTGITGVSTSYSSDPEVSYTVDPTPGQGVDLLWGVREDANADGNKALPWKDVKVTETGGLVLFTFHHALCALGLHVQAMVDGLNTLTDLTDEHDPNLLLGHDVKVTIEKITISSNNGFYEKGTLHLDNTTSGVARWESTSGTLGTLTLESSTIDANLLDKGNVDPDSQPEGVKKDADSQTVIARDGGGTGREQYFLLIPNDTEDKLTVKVDYHITYKTNGGGYKRLDYTTANGNAGTATITGLTLKSDTRYYLNLVLGLRTFGLTVSAQDWTGRELPLSVTVERGTSASESLARQR